MAEITAAMVKALRDKTDAPMMECKKALAEAGGNLDKAEELLRVKLGNKASKAASRVTAEGVVGVHVAADGRGAAMVELNCETDFVAKNEEFVAFARALAALDGTTVDERRRTLIGKIGENISVRRFVRLAAGGRIASYVHGGSRIGVLVDVEGGDEALARDLAMQIAASKPVALDRNAVPADLVEKERSIATQKAAESGKPAEIVAKMVEGAVQKYLKEVTLLGQPFVKDDKQTIEQLLKARGARVHAYALYVVGEGIEKRQADFAAEVAEAAAAASR